MDTSFGIQQKGKRNLITDVAGITVGHCTLADGDVQTGVTALLPHQGDLFHDRCPAAGRGETFKTIKNFRLSKILFDICLSCGIVISEAVCTADVKVKERI